MIKFAQDDRIEQMKQSAKRMRQLEHKRAADAILQDRRDRLALKDLEMVKEQELEDQVRRYKEQVIEQERQRLLLEHASKLAGFLPKVNSKFINNRVYCVIVKIWNCLMKSFVKSLKSLLIKKESWLAVI